MPACVRAGRMESPFVIGTPASSTGMAVQRCMSSGSRLGVNRGTHTASNVSLRA